MTTLPYDEMEKTLQEQFYIDVPFPLSSAEIHEAMQAFFKFLEEPAHIKEHIDLKISTVHRRGDVGFKHRDPDDGIYNDSKDFFHFHPAIFEHYQSFLEENPVVQDFMNKAYPIWKLTHDTVSQILKTFDVKFPGAHSKVFDTKDVHILLRFLKYNWQNSGKYLAKPHYDAGSFTLPIAESCGGLRIGSHPENLKSVQHKESHALFMLSSNFKKVMNTDSLFAAWHDVIQEDETRIGEPFARWALVGFIEASNVEALPRSETHKWFRCD